MENSCGKIAVLRCAFKEVCIKKTQVSIQQNAFE